MSLLTSHIPPRNLFPQLYIFGNRESFGNRRKEQRPSTLKLSVREGRLDVDASLLDLCQNALLCFKIIIGINEV